MAMLNAAIPAIETHTKMAKDTGELCEICGSEEHCAQTHVEES